MLADISSELNTIQNGRYGEDIRTAIKEAIYKVNDAGRMPVIENLNVNANGTYLPSSGVDGFSKVVVNVPSGGGSAVINSLSVSANGTYVAPSGVDGYSPVVVNVPNSYSASDEGKVVSNGTLVTQTSMNVTQNGTYDTTENDEVVVNVSGGGGSTNILSGTDAPAASAGSNGDIYLRYITTGLKNSAGQYINTGYHGNSDSKYVIMFTLDAAQTAQYPTPFGARSAANAVQNASYLSIGNGYNYNASSIGWGTTQTNLSFGAASMIGKVTEITLEAGQLDVMIDDAKSTYTFTPTAITDTTPVGIYTMMINGSVPSFTTGMKDMILYAFDIYESGTLVHSYRPALDENDVACVYDSVSDEYLYHSGGGTLQYINTNTIIKAYAKVNGAWQGLIGTDINDINTGASA